MLTTTIAFVAIQARVARPLAVLAGLTEVIPTSEVAPLSLPARRLIATPIRPPAVSAARSGRAAVDGTRVGSAHHRAASHTDCVVSEATEPVGSVELVGSLGMPGTRELSVRGSGLRGRW